MSYNGPATLLDDLGNEAAVTVSITINASQPIKDWRATGTAAPGDWELTGGVKLRLPDGREGRVLVTNVTYSTSRPTSIQMVGNGEPPA